MNQPGGREDPTNQSLKVEVGASGAAAGSTASSAAAQATNGATAEGTPGAIWANQGLGTGVGGTGAMVTPSISLPSVEPVKTRKKGLSVCSVKSVIGGTNGDGSIIPPIPVPLGFLRVFVRGPNGEDISYFVSKVVFTLHPSFAEATREVRSPPFEVTEMGWGEFEAKMTMHFKDPHEKPVDILHQLRLYHDAAAGTTQPKKAVVAEFYDEVVFTDPYEDFYNTLMKGQLLTDKRNHEQQDHLSSFSDGESLQRLASAREWVHNQLRETKDKIRKADMDLARLKAAAAANSTRGPSSQIRR